MPGDFAKGEAYQRQARSDYSIAQRLDADVALSDADARCHIGAMCQQAIEKSVKSLYIALGGSPRRTHNVYGFAIEMTRITRPEMVRSELSRLFSHSAKRAIRELSSLVPKSNQEDPHQNNRNNEYPFASSGDWVAPCDDRAFSGAETARYLHEAGRIVDGATRIREVLYRLTRPQH